MSYIKQHTRLFTTTLAGLACLLSSTWLCSRIAPAAAANPQQETDRMVYINPQNSMQPVSIEKVTVGELVIQLGVKEIGWRDEQRGIPFQANDDWLKNMSIVVKNRTDEAIVWAGFKLYFPDSGDGRSSPVMVRTITLGQVPEIDSFTSHGEKIPSEPSKRALLLAPGQTLVIQLSDYIDEVQSFVEGTLSWSQVKKVWIAPARFFFVDGMRWDSLYGFGVPDPNRPGQFTNLDRGHYFPGNPSQNWPPADAPGEARVTVQPR